jgi:predicted aspartyl protease
MIEGRFGDLGQIYFDVNLIEGNGLTLPVEAMLDSGFTELIAMNQQDVETLEWSFLRQDRLRTAQGETTFNIYLGRIAIDEQVFEVPVFASNEIQEILLGSQWFKLFTLVANYRGNRVILESY